MPGRGAARWPKTHTGGDRPWPTASAYATAEEYLAWLASLAPSTPPSAEETQAVVALRRELVEQPPHAEQVVERIERRRRTTKKLDFTGFYGPDLFAEVSRYAPMITTIQMPIRLACHFSAR